MKDGSCILAAAAHSEELADRLLQSGRNVLLCDPENSALIYAGSKKKFPLDKNTAAEGLDDLDIVEYHFDNGMYLVWDNDSIENTIITSEKCNSSCVMCPYPDHYRANAKDVSAESITELIRYVIDPPQHITISGGEPTLIGESMFDIMALLKERFPHTAHLFLTNGRIFSCGDYTEKFLENCPRNICFGIPIYGFSPETHDVITRAEAFQETRCLR